MSAFGTKRTYRVALHMSAIGGKADIAWQYLAQIRTGFAKSQIMERGERTAPGFGAQSFFGQMTKHCESHLAAFAWASALPKPCRILAQYDYRRRTQRRR